MIDDYIFFGLIFACFIVFIWWYFIINDKDHSLFTVGDYGKRVKANQIWHFSFFLTFSVLSFVFAFLDVKMNFTKIVGVIFSAISLGIFFYDIFIKGANQEEYIDLLQKTALKSTALKDVFILEEDKADYNLSGNDDTMIIKVIKGREGFALALRREDKNLIFNPKCEMTEKEINFLCKQINFYWTQNKIIPETIQIFENKNLYEYEKQIIWYYSPHFKSETMKKIKRILKKTGLALGLFVPLIMAILLMMESSENTFFKAIVEAVNKWLFN